MSQLKVNAIRATAASSDAITLASDGTCTAKITAINNGQIANRNVLINGAMQINQRGDAAATGSAAYLSADRWKTQNGSGAQWAVSRSTAAPDGFAYSTKWDCTTADTSVGASDYMQITQDLEGQDVQRFHKGKSTAKKFALQFWIKSTITGTYIVNLLDSDNSRQIAKAYTISAADTWEKKTMVFDADTTGAFTVDTNKSLRVSFWLMAGSDYTSGTLATTWASETAANKAVGQVNAVSSTSNNVFITGVQLEVDTCTEFEHRSYNDELVRCYRYCFAKINPADNQYASQFIGTYYNSSRIYGSIQFPVAMRSPPTCVCSDATDAFHAYRDSSSDSVNEFHIDAAANVGLTAAEVLNDDDASGTAGHSCFVRRDTPATVFRFEAEL